MVERMESKDWKIIRSGTGFYLINKRTSKKIGDLRSMVAHLEDQENNYQPMSIQFAQENVKQMVESNVRIVFPTEEFKKKKWQNKDIYTEVNRAKRLSRLL